MVICIQLDMVYDPTAHWTTWTVPVLELPGHQEQRVKDALFHDVTAIKLIKSGCTKGRKEVGILANNRRQ